MDATETNRLDGKLVTMIAVAVISGIAVVVAAFVLSFDAIKAVALAAHVSLSLAWLMAIAIDGAMAVGTMAALVLKMLGKKTGYAWFVVLAGVAISIACNALHATQSTQEGVNLDGGQAGAVSAIPAVALALSLHLVIILIEAISEAVRDRKKNAEAELDTAKAELRPLVEDELRAGLQAELDAARAELEAEVERNRQAELDAARARERAEVEAELEDAISARLAAAEEEFRARAESERAVAVLEAEVQAEARVRREFAEQAKQSGQRKPASQAARKDSDDGLSSIERAKILLAANPEMTGADLGRALGTTDRYGRELLKRIQEGDSDGTEPPSDNVRYLGVSSAG